MSNLAFYASPVDFQQNDKLNNKIKEIKQKKVNSNLLKQLSLPNESEMQNIHANIKDESDETLANFYSEELNHGLAKKINEDKIKQNLQLEGKNKDYLISNNLHMNQVSTNGLYGNDNVIGKNSEILNKLNHIITMFEDQKEIKTGQKNEEVILYCFLGIFVIYVLDSFVYIGKYSR